MCVPLIFWHLSMTMCHAVSTRCVQCDSFFVQKFGEVEEGKEKSVTALKRFSRLGLGPLWYLDLMSWLHTQMGWLTLFSWRCCSLSPSFLTLSRRKTSPHPCMLPKGTHGFLTSPIQRYTFENANPMSFESPNTSKQQRVLFPWNCQFPEKMVGSLCEFNTEIPLFSHGKNLGGGIRGCPRVPSQEKYRLAKVTSPGSECPEWGVTAAPCLGFLSLGQVASPPFYCQNCCFTPVFLGGTLGGSV